MKKLILSLALLGAFAGNAFAGSYTKYIEEVYLENETQFRFKICDGFDTNGSAYGVNTNWFIVNVNNVGPTMFDRLHAQLLSAMNNKRLSWVSTSGTTYNVIQATTYYR